MAYRANNQTKNSLDNLPGNRKQPFITWKYKPNINNYMSDRFSSIYIDNSNSTYNLGIAVNSRPENNNLNKKQFINQRKPIASKYNVKGQANPIKHYRKQIYHSQNTNNRRVAMQESMDIPGGTFKIKDNDCKNVVVNKNYLINNSVDKNCFKCDNNVPNNNPERIQRSASTIVKKNYYQTSTAYLRSRVKLYNQNQTISKIKDNNYLNQENVLIPPSNNKNEGSQLFNSIYCSDLSCNSGYTSKVIYKPNNKNYSQEGAVSSNLRTFNLQKDAINKGAIGLKDTLVKDKKVFSNSIVNNSQFRGNYEAPITEKTFYQVIPGTCNNIQIINTQNSGKQMSGGSGHHVSCNYNEFGNHNSDIKNSLNGKFIIENRGKVNFKIWAKGPLFSDKYNCQTIKQSLGQTRQLQNNNITFLIPNCKGSNTNAPEWNKGTNGEPRSISHR